MDLRLGSLNVVNIIGRATTNPDLRFTPSGAAVLDFNIAVNERYQDKTTQEWKDDVSFIGVVIWRQAAERVAERLHKGSPVMVQGKLKSRAWEEKGTGKKRVVVFVQARSVQVLEKLPKQGEGEQADAPGGDPQEPDVPQDQLDDIPF
jgi:single stranded DNA-binding protein